MTDLIIHHYDESPYAEKVRTLLGYKGLAWQSVVTPRMLPKPDLTALTGGYRKAPVLQIGADVYCDSRLIAQVLEQRAPTPSTAHHVPSWNMVVEHWVDLELFGKAVAFTFSQIVDFLDDAFLADRAGMQGRPVPSREDVKRSGPLAHQALTTAVAWVEGGLREGALFVNGEQPGSGDFTMYCALWFARIGRFDFTPYPATLAWMKRMKAFGHGQRTESNAQAALDAAKAAEPVALSYDSVSPDPAGVALGQTVAVQPELVGKESVQGELVGINADQLTLLVQSERCGKVHVHFPRVGYRIRAVSP